ncbi:MAG: hypothetical protein KGM47_10900 [Acidobacteriota bacterium]|nr:hypothetical protein [Acidobacteriota bacterium]
MIGVIANQLEHPVVREFFELFKTPWEFYRSGRPYDVLLLNGDARLEENDAELVLLYAGEQMPFDAEESIVIKAQGKHAQMLSYRERRIPIYGNCVTFREGSAIVVDEQSRRPAMRTHRARVTTVIRLGYDLFSEIRTLLTEGQPADNADIPALELHIALLRDLITTSGIALVEIPPVPDGYRFIACLTHDIDHPSVRRHKFDHTMLGFLYRASIGSLRNLIRRRISVRTLVRTWLAALKLPLVHLGLAKDFWTEFDRYVELDPGSKSTFFVIPFEDRPGEAGEGPAPIARAARYGAADVSTQIRKLMSAGCEIGLHGIDAWLDARSGRAELEEIRRTSGLQDIGVRMHWLYFGEQSPAALDQAGATYDSTIGYNETIGYRAGTAQVFKPFGATRLLELPLHVMDTALFFPSHLDLSPTEASKRVTRIIDNAVQFGGCVTVNWHDRSTAPERCWGDFYMNLVGELKRAGAWFATAGEAVAWFRKRRAVTFDESSADGDVPLITMSSGADEIPGLQLRAYEGRPITLDHVFDCRV